MTTVKTPQVPRRLHPFILGIAFLSTFYVALLAGSYPPDRSGFVGQERIRHRAVVLLLRPDTVPNRTDSGQ